MLKQSLALGACWLLVLGATCFCQTTDVSPPQAKSESPQDAPGPAAVKVNPITDSAATSGANYKPLTGRQRWQLYLNQNFTSVGAYLGIGFSALLDQASNRPREWGGGVAGFGRRFGSRFGANVIGGSIQSAGDAALHLDPRYIRSVSHSPARRVGHALLYTFMTNNDAGQMRFNLPNIGSYYASSMIATKWQPGHQTATGDGVRDANRQLITGAAFNVVQEFWPEISKLLRHAHINLD